MDPILKEHSMCRVKLIHSAGDTVVNVERAVGTLRAALFSAWLWTDSISRESRAGPQRDLDVERLSRPQFQPVQEGRSWCPEEMWVLGHG